MAIKKSEIYSQIWAACDKLRGGVEPARYKDYILTLLFVKYVSDRFKSSDNWDIEVPDGGSFDDIVALKYKKNIGEGINMDAFFPEWRVVKETLNQQMLDYMSE